MSDEFKQVCAPGWDKPVATTASNGTMTVGSCGHFCEACARRDDRIEELEKQLAERDAALARCVEALGTIELEASIFRVDPPMSEDELMAKFEAISELAGNTLESLPSSAKATAKVLAAARWVPCDEQMPDLVGRDDSHVPGGAPATLYSERVLVFDGTVRIDNLIQAEGSPETRTFYVGSRKPVTHWMPLPEPPEAIREEQAQK